MELLLVQHGEAKTEAEDPVRPLTERGADAVRSMAVWAARAGVKVDQIRHSGKRRAEQTAASRDGPGNPDSLLRWIRSHCREERIYGEEKEVFG